MSQSAYDDEDDENATPAVPASPFAAGVAAATAAAASGQDDDDDDDDEEEVEGGIEGGAASAENSELAEVKEQLMRTMADMENLRKRAARDQEESNKFAVSGFARDLVSVLENLQRATESIPSEMRESNEQVKNLAMGVEMTMQELLSVFERNGIKRVEPKVGDRFDHNYQQAMQQIEDDTVEPGTILQVLQNGYIIHDRLLRPALVNVSKKGAGEPEAQVSTEA